MRTPLIATMLLLILTISAKAGQNPGPTFPEILPSTTIFCLVPPDDNALEAAYRNSIFRGLADLPEMAPFFNGLDAARDAFTRDLMKNAGIDQDLANAIAGGRLGVALINIALGHDGSPQPEVALVLTLPAPPNRDQVYSAFTTLLNRPDVVKAALESQGLDPNLPIRTLVQQEDIPGYPSILRIGPQIRIAVIGRMILLYRGLDSGGIRAIFDAAAKPASSLAATPMYQAAREGTGAKPGSMFAYLNMPRFLMLLDALNVGSIGNLVESLGLGSAQALGVSGGYHDKGVRHDIYVHAPGQRQGLFSALVPVRAAPQGVENYAKSIPSQAESFTSARIDIAALAREIPYLLAASGKQSGPAGGKMGLSGMLLERETILGVQVGEAIQALGQDVVIQPHDDTLVFRFDNVDANMIANIVARMEQNAGTRFRAINVGGYQVRYFNQRSGLELPLAPAFCLIPLQQPQGRGVLYLATHPQALVSLIREAANSREALAAAPDFRKAMAGMDSGYSFFYYSDARQSYRRVYNFLLPIAAVWAGSAAYPVDTGLLPTADAIVPSLFGTAIGVKKTQNGVLINAYSPFGINGAVIIGIDKFVISNAAVIASLASTLSEVMATANW